MNRLKIEKRADVIAHLVRGVSVRDTAALTKVSPTTVLKLLEEIGAECAVYLHYNMVKLPCTKIQADEMWSFVKMKEKNVPPYLKGQLGYGDTWSWLAFCPDSKLVPCFLVGRRDTENAIRFIDDLSWRFGSRVQLSSDGLAIYKEAVELAFGGNVDFAMLKKRYGGVRVFQDGTTKRCRTNEFSGSSKEVVCGRPDFAHITTAGVERVNRTSRSGVRRLARRTDAHSKKLANHHYMTAIFYAYYNYCRIHSSLRTTPAQAAGLERRVWDIEDIVKLAA
ncbi:MAG: IS1 family transposase [Desulfovibrionaceae bacterium]|nr:IS1 family transposase [Desulfovibrionaceae bacterium]